MTDTTANFTLDGNTVTLEKAEGRHAEGTYSLTGRLLLENLRIPQVDATGTGTRGDRPFTLKFNGPAASATLVIQDSAPEPPPAPTVEIK